MWIHQTMAIVVSAVLLSACGASLQAPNQAQNATSTNKVVPEQKQEQKQIEADDKAEDEPLDFDSLIIFEPERTEPIYYLDSI